MNLANLAVEVVLPEPCRPTIIITTGGTASNERGSAVPSISMRPSLTILTICWPGVTDFKTCAPMAAGRTLSRKARATGKATSASKRAVRISPSAASTSFSDSAPRPRKRSNIEPKFSLSVSNMRFAFRLNQNCTRGQSLLAGGDLAPLGEDQNKYRFCSEVAPT